MDQLKDILIYLLTPSTPIFLVGGLIVLLVPILVHVFVQQTTPYTTLPSILLAGPPGGGKTALLTLLERGFAPAPELRPQLPREHARDLLPGLDYQWAHLLRERYRADALDELANLSRDALQRSDEHALARTSSQALDIDPYNERCYRTLAAIHSLACFPRG